MCYTKVVVLPEKIRLHFMTCLNVLLIFLQYFSLLYITFLLGMLLF